MLRLTLMLLCIAVLAPGGLAADWEVANNGLMGYTVADIVIDFRNPSILYCSTKSGVYKSTNGGSSWYKSSSGMVATPYAAQMCMDPTNPARVYVQAADASGYRYVWRTDNSGASWTQKASGINHPWIRGVTVSKSDPNIVYCGTIIGGDNGGCYKSTNSGDTWTQVAGSDIAGSGLENDCSPVVVDPTNPDRVYCGRTYYDSFLKSTDGGYHWSWTDTSYVVRGIAINPGNTARIIACGEGKLRLSTDYGGTFTTKVSGVSFQAVAHAPSDPNIAYATATSGGIWKSTDAGDTWAQISGSELYGFGRLAIHPENPDTLFCVVSGRGIARSTDGGHTFTFTNTGLPTEIAVSFLRPGFSGSMYAFVNYVGLYRTFDEGASWQFVSTMSDFPKGLEICQASPSTMYYTAWPVDKVMKSTDGGFTWAPTPTAPAAASYYESVAVDPTDPNRVFAAAENTDKVYRTTDGGQTWQAVHDLTNSPDWGNRTAWSITIDPSNPRRVYLATYNHPWRSDDGGNTWVMQNTLHYGVYYGNPPVLKDTSFVRQIDIDPASPNIIYASTQWGGTWKSTDYGDHWSKIWDQGGSTTNNTVIDSRDHNIIYITTLGQGIQRSTNGGLSWTTMSGGLVGNDVYPNVIRQSQANPSRLFVGASVSGTYRTPGGGWGLSIDQARALPDGAYCLLAQDPIVALKYPDSTGCLENPDRLRGIRAANLGVFGTGDRVHVQGTIRVDDADRYLQVDKISLVSSGNLVRPLALGAKALSSPGAPTGIHARMWGSITESGPGFCYVDDGAGATDGTGRRGVKVHYAKGMLPLEVGTFAALDGVLGFSTQDGLTVPCLVLHDQSDVLIGTIANYLRNPGLEAGTLEHWTIVGSQMEVPTGEYIWGITPHSGSHFAGIYGSGVTYSGVLYQSAEVGLGKQVRASVWSRVLHGGNGTNSASNRIGLDPTGGTDPNSPGILWSAWDTQTSWYGSVWRQIATPAAVTTGAWCTVFLQYVGQNASGWHVNCYDDAVVKAVP